MVGDPGIEPGMGLPGGVTVRCRTLQHVARTWPFGPLRGAEYAPATGPSRRNCLVFRAFSCAARRNRAMRGR